jgi:hypothetical protein
VLGFHKEGPIAAPVLADVPSKLGIGMGGAKSAYVGHTDVAAVSSGSTKVTPF